MIANKIKSSTNTAQQTTQMNNKILVNLIFLNGSQYLVQLLPKLSVISQVKDFLSKKNQPTENLQVMFDCKMIHENETLSDLEIVNGSYLDCLFKVNRENASPSLINHVISEGMNVNKFTFYG